MENTNVEVIDLTEKTEEKQIVQEVGEIFTQIVNELVGLRQDLKPIGGKIIEKYENEIDDLYAIIDELKKKLLEKDTIINDLQNTQ